MLPVTVMPFRPVPKPSMSRPWRMTWSFTPAEITMALVPETSTPASNVERIVIDFVMVTPPKPPGSRTLISPPPAVLEMAPAKVLHGAVRLQGFASSPTPETQVRVACALAGATLSIAATIPPKMVLDTASLFIRLLLVLVKILGRSVPDHPAEKKQSLELGPTTATP